jgi:hyperosmotically inducible periplasmic protein
MSFLRVKSVASATMAGLCLSVVLMPGLAMAQMPDNTAQNKGDTQTADKQSNAKADRDITAKVRKEIVGDKDLSTYAHNVKVITVNGAVTLKGPVKSEDEKAKVAELASNVVSADKVTNELTVK